MTHHWGYVGVATAATLFGISATLNKIVLSDVHPLIVAGLIYLIAGVTLFAVRYSPLNKKILLLLKTPTKTEKIFSKKDYRILMFVIIFGALIAPSLFMYGLNETTAVNTSLLLNTESLFTVFIAIVFLGERVMKKDYAGMILIITGTIFVTTSAEFQKLELTKGVFGSMLVIAACLFWGLDNNLSRFLSKKQDLILVTALKCFIGGSILLIISLLMGITFNVPLIAFPYLFTVGAFSIGFSILLFLFALREIGAMKTGVIFSTSSLIGALFAFVILNESFTVVQMLAGVVMLCGVYLLYRKPLFTRGVIRSQKQ
jgi:drug/metabolite transporter (DMT)-like permease